MPVIPFIPTIVSAVGGGIASKFAQKNAMKRSPEEQAALAGASGAAGSMGRQGSELIGQGGGYLGQAGNYYSTLLGGNRAQMAQATAGPRAALTDVYRGAERGLERSGVRGAARDVATADLGRQRASSLSSLVTGVQPGAAAGLAGLGGQALSAGGQLSQGSGSIYSNLLGQGAQNRQYGRQEGQNFGSGVGGFLFDILNSSGKFGGKGGVLPSRRIPGGFGPAPSLPAGGRNY